VHGGDFDRVGIALQTDLGGLRLHADQVSAALLQQELHDATRAEVPAHAGLVQQLDQLQQVRHASLAVTEREQAFLQAVAREQLAAHVHEAGLRPDESKLSKRRQPALPLAVVFVQVCELVGGHAHQIGGERRADQARVHGSTIAPRTRSRSQASTES
jgi:hypothetical protein